MYFPIRKGFFRRVTGYVRAVDNVSFSIQEGETLGLVGESGCGKTTTGRCILRAYDPTEGEILFRMHEDEPINLAALKEREMREVWRNMQLIFQDPYGSLNPRMTVKDIIGEPLLVQNVAKGGDLKERVGELMRKVGLRPEYMERYPHAFSGGQRQRIGIARALALNPKLIVCDEPVSALDVSIQAQTLNLLNDLQLEFQLTYLFIAHDLGVVRYISDRVAVMYVGKLVELAKTGELFNKPLHPYTEALLSAVPKHNPKKKSQRIPLAGEVADPADPPTGCYFHPRCRYAEDKCKTEEPALSMIKSDDGNEHYAACHFADSLELKGI
jgi:peptide/nickel transport system ATP-binding protein